MLKGTLEGIVLAILAGRSAYGYEIRARSTSTSSGGRGASSRNGSNSSAIRSQTHREKESSHGRTMDRVDHGLARGQEALAGVQEARGAASAQLPHGGGGR